VSDATILLRDIAGDAATKTAGKVKPSEDQLGQIDHAAEDNTWHETPDLSRDNLRGQMKSRMPIGKGDLKEAAGDASEAAGGSRDPRDVADRTAQDQQQGTQSVDPQQGAQQGAQNVKNKISGNMNEDQKQKAREYRERTNQYFKEKVPKERRDQVVYRLKKMVVEIQGHQDCKLMMHGLLPST